MRSIIAAVCLTGAAPVATAFAPQPRTAFARTSVANDAAARWGSSTRYGGPLKASPVTEEDEKLGSVSVSGTRWFNDASSKAAAVAVEEDTSTTTANGSSPSPLEASDIETFTDLTLNGGEPSAAAVAAAIAEREPEQDQKVFHIGVLVATTLWWYIYSAVTMVENPAGFLGLPTWAIDAAAAYAPISQLGTYGCLWKLMTAKTLRESQGWIIACIMLCVPADTLIVLFDPTGSQLATVLAFCLVTLCYGVVLAHYVRLACRRENEANGIGFDDALTASHKVYEGGPIEYLKNYRTPENLQATHMAIDFAKAFCGFTIALAAFRDTFTAEGDAEFWLIASCITVGLHATIEMVLTTVFPGSDLEEYPSFVRAETGLYLFDIIASLFIGQAAGYDHSIWDELVYSWLFGNATADFMGNIALMNEGVNYDKKLGLVEQEEATA